ncbi:MAG: hypothetical protein ACLRPW_04750 [Intestinibacter sp.]
MIPAISFIGVVTFTCSAIGVKIGMYWIKI